MKRMNIYGIFGSLVVLSLVMALNGFAGQAGMDGFDYDRQIQAVWDSQEAVFEQNQIGGQRVIPMAKHVSHEKPRASKPYSMDMQMTEKDDTYVITLAIPRMDEKHMDVRVEKNLISVEGTYIQTREKKDAQGRVVRQDVSKTLSRGFSIPLDADYMHAVVNKKQDGFVITMPKLAGGSV